MNEKCFQDKCVLITGASSGIGRATALAFGAEGARVIIHYNNKEAQAAEVLSRVVSSGGSGELLQGDLSTMSGTRKLCDIVATLPVDILVNNAGSLIRRTPVLEFTENLWEQVMVLNLTSAFFLAQAVLPGMVSRQSGAVINVSSVAARNGGGIGALAYATAKAGLSTMTKGLAKEFAPKGIQVNAVSPGTVDTEYHQTFSTTAMLDSVRSATPMGRLGTSPEIAGVILFLASPAARFMQGQVVEVNGGFLMA